MVPLLLREEEEGHAGRGGGRAAEESPPVKAGLAACGFSIVWWRGMRTNRGEALTSLNCSSSAGVGVSQGRPRPTQNHDAKKKKRNNVCCQQGRGRDALALAKAKQPRIQIAYDLMHRLCSVWARGRRDVERADRRAGKAEVCLEGEGGKDG